MNNFNEENLEKENFIEKETVELKDNLDIVSDTNEKEEIIENFEETVEDSVDEISKEEKEEKEEIIENLEENSDIPLKEIEEIVEESKEIDNNNQIEEEFESNKNKIDFTNPDCIKFEKSKFMNFKKNKDDFKISLPKMYNNVPILESFFYNYFTERNSEKKDKTSTKKEALKEFKNDYENIEKSFLGEKNIGIFKSPKKENFKFKFNYEYKSNTKVDEKNNTLDYQIGNDFKSEIGKNLNNIRDEYINHDEGSIYEKYLSNKVYLSDKSSCDIDEDSVLGDFENLKPDYRDEDEYEIKDIFINNLDNDDKFEQDIVNEELNIDSEEANKLSNNEYYIEEEGSKNTYIGNMKNTYNEKILEVDPVIVEEKIEAPQNIEIVKEVKEEFSNKVEQINYETKETEFFGKNNQNLLQDEEIYLENIKSESPKVKDIDKLEESENSEISIDSINIEKKDIGDVQDYSEDNLDGIDDSEIYFDEPQKLDNVEISKTSGTLLNDTLEEQLFDDKSDMNIDSEYEKQSNYDYSFEEEYSIQDIDENTIKNSSILEESENNCEDIKIIDNSYLDEELPSDVKIPTQKEISNVIDNFMQNDTTIEEINESVTEEKVTLEDIKVPSKEELNTAVNQVIQERIQELDMQEPLDIKIPNASEVEKALEKAIDESNEIPFNSKLPLEEQISKSLEEMFKKDDLSEKEVFDTSKSIGKFEKVMHNNTDEYESEMSISNILGKYNKEEYYEDELEKILDKKRETTFKADEIQSEISEILKNIDNEDF